MTAIPLDAKPLPCTGHAASFDVLIEGRVRSAFDRIAVARAAAECWPLCASCPIRAACWTANADEDWVKRLKSVRRTQKAAA